MFDPSQAALEHSECASVFQRHEIVFVELEQLDHDTREHVHGEEHVLRPRAALILRDENLSAGVRHGAF